MTQRELERLGQLTTPHGVSALAIARRLDHADLESPHSLVALSRVHLEIIDEIMDMASAAASPRGVVDEVKARRERRGRGHV